MATSAQDVLLIPALQEIGAYAPGETPSNADLQFALDKLNGLIDTWNTRKLFVWNVNFNTYIIIPNTQPLTIGPSGANYTVTERPVKIINANIVINTTNPVVRNPLNLRDDDWWANNRVQGVQGQLPTDLYYVPSWPNGQLNLWPIPNIAYGLELETWNVISSIASFVTTVSLPPGYTDALKYTLAEMLCPAFAAAVNPQVQKMARDARAAIQSLNSASPDLTICDSGMPLGGADRPSFNWRVGFSTTGPRR
jgi:hypothetical protein